MTRWPGPWWLWVFAAWFIIGAAIIILWGPTP
jgi:hypothetical protein